MGRPGVAADAAVLAASVGVQPEAEGNVRAVVFGENLPCGIPEELRLDTPPLVFFQFARVDLSAEAIKVVGRVFGCSTSAPFEGNCGVHDAGEQISPSIACAP